MRPKILDSFIAVDPPKDWRFRDLTGQTFGRLRVVSYAGGRYYRWNCQCDCGNKVAITGANLRGGVTKSCGCLHKEASIAAHTTHGEGSTPGGTVTSEYRTYLLAKARCTNPTDHAFKDYGGRGIEFHFKSYEHFLATVGRKPSPRHTLDRVDVNGHYEPGNVRWATWHQQQRNRRNNRLITIGGVTRCQSAWAEIYGISTKRIHSRRVRGWCDICAITVPLMPGKGDGNVCQHNYFR